MWLSDVHFFVLTCFLFCAWFYDKDQIHQIMQGLRKSSHKNVIIFRHFDSSLCQPILQKWTLPSLLQFTVFLLSEYQKRCTIIRTFASCSEACFPVPPAHLNQGSLIRISCRAWLVLYAKTRKPDQASLFNHSGKSSEKASDCQAFPARFRHVPSWFILGERSIPYYTESLREKRGGRWFCPLFWSARTAARWWAWSFVYAKA